jgi:hypothetical protein
MHHECRSLSALFKGSWAISAASSSGTRFANDPIRETAGVDGGAVGTETVGLGGLVVASGVREDELTNGAEENKWLNSSAASTVT